MKGIKPLLSGPVMPLEPLIVYLTSDSDSLANMLDQCSVFAPLTIQPHRPSAPPPSEPGVWLRDFQGSSSAVLSVFCRQITKHPYLAPLAVVECIQNETITYALHHGIDAFLTKPLAADTLKDTLSLLAAKLARRLHRQQLAKLLTPLMDQLSSRERMVLEGCRQGHPTKVLANYLHLSEKTISMYRCRLMKRFDVQNSIQLALCASWWHFYCQGQLV